MPNNKVFFSYSKKDSQFAINLAKHLREAGVGIWLDILDMKPNEDFEESYENALQFCDIVLIILSKNAVNEIGLIMDDYSYAIENNKRVVPILLEECEIPLRLRRLPYADFSLNPELGMKKLAEMLQFNIEIYPTTSGLSSNKKSKSRETNEGVKSSRPQETNRKPWEGSSGFPNRKPGWFKFLNVGSSGTKKTGNSASVHKSRKRTIAHDEVVRRSGSVDESKTSDPSFPLDFNKQKQEKKKEVSVNIYAPPKFQRGRSQFIQIWIFKPVHKNQVEEKAVLLDDEAMKLGYENLLLPIKKGSEITLVLSSKDISYREQKSLIWMEEINHKNFDPEIPNEYNNNKVIFKLEVFVNELICGEIIFMMKEGIGNDNYGLKPTGEMALRYKKAFISYASKDRKKVLERVQGIAASKIYDIFQDILELDPGERWERRLYKEIDLCDVFFLFWSKASSKSKWVIKELDYAIGLKREDSKGPVKIQPVIIPPIVKPPKQLQHLHFNDRIVQFLIAEEQINKTRKKN